MSSTSSQESFSFGEGIQNVLDAIAFPENTREIFYGDAQIIENSIISEMKRIDPIFHKAFYGLNLAGSAFDNIKIDLPDEFDMHVKIHPNCSLEPIAVPNRPGFIFLKASNDRDPCVKRFNNGYFVSRLAVQLWFYQTISQIMPKLQHIRCSRRRVYSLEYTAHGKGVAHTLVATQRGKNEKKISFDFVPVYEFTADEWPRGLNKPKNAQLNWFAVPRKYFDSPELQDSRSFIVSAQYWERLAMFKKENLKDSLRLMKAFRNANNMPGLVSYFLKSIYLNAVANKEVNWKQEPGRILIRMLVNLLICLQDNHLAFYLAPDHNLLDKLRTKTKFEYIRIVRRNLKKLIRRRNADYLTEDDIYDLFGIEVDFD